MAFVRYFDEATRTVGEQWIDESATDGVRDRFDRIRRTRACYRCGAGPEHCECPDEMEPDGVR